MKINFLDKLFTTVGVLAVLANGSVAHAQAAAGTKSVGQTNIVAPTPMAPSQASAPISRASIPSSPGKSPPPGYLNGKSSTVLGGQLGPGPIGGAFSTGPIGGVMTVQNPPGGQRNGIIISGAITPGFPPGGVMSGSPVGGSFGSNILGGLRTPSNSYSAGPRGVIIGGAQTAGISPGGVSVAGAQPGGAMVGGVAPGGILVQGAPPNTNAPGGQLH